MTSIFAGAFAFGVGFDVGITKFYDAWNKGVRMSRSVRGLPVLSSLQKQWKDIRDRYVQAEDS